MELRRLLQEDDSAVSPVIGVILMVAITVILAAVIASFVLGMGPDTATTPSATFDSEWGTDADGDVLTLTMSSGETIDTSNLEFAGPVSDSATSNVSNNGSLHADAPSELTAGTQLTVGLNNSDEDVRLIYSSGDSSSTMQTFEP